MTDPADYPEEYTNYCAEMCGLKDSSEPPATSSHSKAPPSPGRPKDSSNPPASR